MLRINALGRLVVVGESGPILGSAAQPRRLALLAVIARAGTRGVTRTRILQLLWPESDEEHGRGVLSKALSALRRDLGAEDVFLATNNDVRLNPAVITSDLDEFDAAFADGRLDRAVSLYIGPFLDGFRVAGAVEFERWASGERTSIERDYIVALRALAEAAATRGDHADASRWWTKLAGYEPLNTRHTLGLMRALVAAGEPRAALQHARVYELLVTESLDVPADGAVIALATEIRSAMHPAPAGQNGALGTTSDAAIVRDNRVAVVRGRSRRWAVAAAALVAVALTAAGAWRMTRPAGAARQLSSIEPVIAFGHIIDHRPGARDDLPTTLIDRVANEVARAGTVRTTSISHARDVLADISANGEVDDAMVAAARRAGATELVDGALYPVADGLRLDLRRTDLRGGALRALASVTAADASALADTAAARLVAAIGARRAPELERLATAAHQAHASTSSALGALADSLVSRYPREPEGHLFTGLGLVAAGRFLDARAPLHRAIALDAASIDGSDARCVACDALASLVTVYQRADSVAAAERVASTWVRLSPGSAVARERLAGVVAWRDSVRARAR